ncbi:glycine receptor subunit alpha-2-like isoform X2 [Eriocheir sinensis]|uniref:glycine receptor subunit alpha-2-like isoform X2 n=1 Tax=Eriocheir sinensis TaxID=95602 RepID=UPI0021CA78D2|nr:glycine receptor subunit alpha-2-like isoform X2 [Eriocheir sinensis]
MANTVFLWLAVLTWAGVAGGLKLRVQEALNLDEYDRDIRPNQGSGPTKVNVSMAIHSLIVDESRQMLELSGDLLQEWYDKSLTFSSDSYKISSIQVPATSGSMIKESVWLPDLHAAQQVYPTKTGADFLRVHANGLISWTQKIHVYFPCRLNLKSYPLRSHPCTLRLDSVGYLSEEMEPEWNGEPPVPYQGAVVSHGYTIAKVDATSKTHLTSGHKTKRQLQLLVEVAPRSGWAVKHTVIPMVSTVTTAYLAFFINIRGVCARVIICMLSLVTAAIFHESTYRKVPPAHDTMAIEVFTGTCLAFIFVAAVESVVVDVLGHFPTKGRQPLSPNRNSFALEPDFADDHASSRGQVAALWLDRCFRVLYPAGFLAFNAVYWVVYN